MRVYERPTLILVGSFVKVTGIKDKGPPDLLGQHSIIKGGELPG